MMSEFGVAVGAMRVREWRTESRCLTHCLHASLQEHKIGALNQSIYMEFLDPYTFTGTGTFQMKVAPTAPVHVYVLHVHVSTS